MRLLFENQWLSVFQKMGVNNFNYMLNYKQINEGIFADCVEKAKHEYHEAKLSLYKLEKALYDVGNGSALKYFRENFLKFNDDTMREKRQCSRCQAIDGTLQPLAFECAACGRRDTDTREATCVARHPTTPLDNASDGMGYSDVVDNADDADTLVATATPANRLPQSKSSSLYANASPSTEDGKSLSNSSLPGLESPGTGKSPLGVRKIIFPLPLYSNICKLCYASDTVLHYYLAEGYGTWNSNCS